MSEDTVQASGPGNSFSPEEEKEAERACLTQAFKLVHRRSENGLLTQTSDFEDKGLVPEHMSPEDFEMFVFDYIEEHKQQAPGDEAKEAKVFRTAETTVGIPRMFQAQKEAPLGGDDAPDEAGAHDPEAEETDSASSAEGLGQQGQSEDVAIDEEHENVEASMEPEPVVESELVEIDGKWVIVTSETSKGTQDPDCSNIEVLMGHASYYLYDDSVMTDAYARWAFLAAEDDRIATFVECVRSESKVYPRPMAAQGLMNDPFSLTEDEINEVWETVSQMDEYSDIGKTVASNGAVYFYSRQYLNDPYAAALAEWEAVDRSKYL